MSTVIYPSPIFGPVHSRRLGVSLGINLMPADGKVCTFDCIYCECGFNADRRPSLPRPTRAEVAAALERKLQQMKAEGKLESYARYAQLDNPEACYLAIYNKEGKVLAILSPGSDRRNVATGRPDGVKNYSGCGAIGFMVNE